MPPVELAVLPPGNVGYTCKGSRNSQGTKAKGLRAVYRNCRERAVTKPTVPGAVQLRAVPQGHPRLLQQWGWAHVTKTAES